MQNIGKKTEKFLNFSFLYNNFYVYGFDAKEYFYELYNSKNEIYFTLFCLKEIIFYRK